MSTEEQTARMAAVGPLEDTWYSIERKARGVLVRAGDAALLAALREAGWGTATTNDADRVTASLSRRGYDLRPIPEYTDD